MKNYYEILDVAADAEFVEIKSAFRTLAKKYHPDVARGESVQFQRLKEAFDTLSDPARRRDYDKQIGYYRPLSNSFRDRRVNVPAEVRDVYDDLVDVVADRFHFPRKRILRFELFLSDHEFKNGARSAIAIPQEKICADCFGFGGSLLHVCRACGGSGLIEFEISFDLILEPPLRPGQVYELKKNGYLLRFQLRKGELNG